MTERTMKEQRREQRRALSREQILDAAELTFSRRGFHDASLREIAELSEFSVGAVYSFFVGKDDIYRAIFARRGAEFMPGMAEVLRGDGSPRRRLLDLAAWQVGFFRRYPHFARLVLSGGPVGASIPADDPVLEKNAAAALSAQADLIRAGQERGELRAGPPAALALMFSGLVSAFQATELRFEPGARLPLADLLAIIEDAFAA